DEAWGDKFTILEIKPAEDLLSPELINPNSWITTPGASISGNKLFINLGTNGTFRQSLSLNSYSTYSISFTASGPFNVTVRNSREVLFERSNLMSSTSHISGTFKTESNNTGLYVELSRRSGGGGHISFENVSIK
ncbi:hypothetical protein P4I81_10155, partial [Bacillus cereus]|nr:hypothetical protein [Bacillus cereus]MEB9015630.1 hypothetical protein [Bacillus cereus]MEB9024987.1 hypothetical protein [Bacillus cereus]MEB9045025.1 hypothetical protein [Bacillus cereus]MEB9124655.1 hypothetical protein [Bacillus cereus]